MFDVRPENEYTAGHVADAVSVPIDTLSKRVRDLPVDAEIVAYCRGPYCVYADDAVRILARGAPRGRLSRMGARRATHHWWAIDGVAPLGRTSG